MGIVAINLIIKRGEAMFEDMLFTTKSVRKFKDKLVEIISHYEKDSFEVAALELIEITYATGLRNGMIARESEKKEMESLVVFLEQKAQAAISEAKKKMR